MKNWFLSACVLTAMVLALSIATAVPSAVAAPNPQPAAAAAPAPEPHPEIRAAMNSLERAKSHLQQAAHDFGGHRVDAIKAIDEAHHQLEICLQYDK
ncbi:MAG TPA: hypothetical protein VNU84_06605 [Candidatus Acidoferrum sp.]|nr:hypothetical protein [Candidatus Acidoferrum sp.]